MINCQTGEYKYPYTNETAKTIKKLCKKLPRDFKYSGTISEKEPDGTKTKYIIFQRLEADSFGYLLHNINTESCKAKMENVASPKWRKLQTLLNNLPTSATSVFGSHKRSIADIS